ncbi:unnamed protein product [Cladocopium goreaui]|uniref:Copia protein n=1 Tax=Cladocopium goreaui TaxID=2562237 RepID=A0A9P1C7B8_9DINO|nr:unnamed protein product [Cladocopium goreaui]
MVSYKLGYLLVILLVQRNYTFEEEKVSKAQSQSQIPVALPQSGTVLPDPFAALGHQATSWKSPFSRPRFSCPFTIRNVYNSENAVDVCVVSEVESTQRKPLWQMRQLMATLCRCQLPPWTARRQFTEEKNTLEGKKKSKKEKADDMPALDPPWNGDDNAALPSPSIPDNKAETRLQELVNELKKPGNTLTTGVQQIVSEMPDSPAATAANMQSACAKLEKARKNYKDALKERHNMHAKWSNYLAQSVSRWKKFATEFTEKDQGLENKVQKAKETLQAARERVDVTKEALTKVDAEILDEDQVISAEEEEMDTTEKLDSADTIKAGITDMVATLENITKLTAPADPDGQVAKRARTEEGGPGLDLAWELDTAFCPAVPQIKTKTRVKDAHVSLATGVDFYVGHEDDIMMGKWKTSLTAPTTSILFPDPADLVEGTDNDLTSFMAAVAPNSPSPLAEAPITLMENPNIAQQTDEENHGPQVQEAPQSPTDASDAVSDVPTEWYPTVVYSLHHEPISAWLDWDDRDETYRHVAGALDIHVDRLLHLQQVYFTPADLRRLHVEALIAYEIGDIPEGADGRAVLLDIEFHSHLPRRTPEIIRRIFLLPSRVQRSGLLQGLGLLPHCTDAEGTELIWHNDDVCRQSHSTWIDLTDGDYVRIALPPHPAEQLNHLPTRFVASARFRGLSVQDIFSNDLMTRLGWMERGTVTTRSVPTDYDFDLHEDVALFQTHQFTPAIIDAAVKRCRLDYDMTPLRQAARSDEERDPRPTQGIQDQLPVIQGLHLLWQLQGAFERGRAVLVTAVKPEHPMEHLATYMPVVAGKTDIIMVAQLEMHCLPQTSELQCMIWHGDRQLNTGQQWHLVHGTGLEIIINPPLPGPSANVAWDHSDDEVELLQRTSRHTVSLDELIPNVEVVKLKAENPTQILPTYLEIPAHSGIAGVQAELCHWGLCCEVHRFGKRSEFLCIDETHSRDITKFHYMLCHDDLCDEDGAILHSTDVALQQPQLMELLCSLGYPRAVIMSHCEVDVHLYCVRFMNVQPEIQDDRRSNRVPTPWPQRHDLQWQQRKLFEPPPLQDSDSDKDCCVQTPFLQQHIVELTSAGTYALCTDFSSLELPEYIKDVMTSAATGDLNADWDRWLIFTDGSSQTKNKHCTPEYVDAVHTPDAWAMLVLGEKFHNDGTSQICPLGWTAHPVRTDPTGCCYAGATRIGADIAEREGLLWAGLWRITQNCITPTVFCVDSKITSGQAIGAIGVSEPDLSYRLLRGVFQCLQRGLPRGHLEMHHVRAHTGDPYNEFVDCIAKREASCSYNLPRLKIDMQEHMQQHQLIDLYSQVEDLQLFGDNAATLPEAEIPRLLPPLQAEGPLNVAPRLRADPGIDDSFFVYITDAVGPGMCMEDFIDTLKNYATDHAISWTAWCNTVQFFAESFGADDAIFANVAWTDMQNCLRSLCNEENFPFLQMVNKKPLPADPVSVLEQQCVTASEQMNYVNVGNELLFFSLEALMELVLTDGWAIIEHPAPPQKEHAPSIWKLAVIQALLALPQIETCRFCQGLLGAFSPKPTQLLLLNLPGVILALHRWRVRRELPRAAAIGLDSQGRWCTTPLKEYPPAMCGALAESLGEAFCSEPTADACQPAQSDLDLWRRLHATVYGRFVGADYAG